MTLVQLAQNNGPDGSEGNYGLWDQLTALNWIKRNIESFAGDSNNIVIFGPDSASALPLALISQQRRQLEEVEFATQDRDIKEKKDEPEFKEKEEKGRGRGRGVIEDGKVEKIGKESFSKLVVNIQNGGKSDGKEADGVLDLAINQQQRGNQIYVDPQQEQQQQQQQQHDSLYSNRDLFRAVWLTNPTVYYELPYEMASKHYQRLFVNQSPCLRLSTPSKAAIKSNISENSIVVEKSRAESSQLISNKSENGKLDEAGRGRKSEKKPLNQQQHQQPPSDKMIECLMSLSSEQVVRHYLGGDDPSYRLDDQNSLPIHGIFADQFVTVDRELVQDSYPFFSNLDLIRDSKSLPKSPIEPNGENEKNGINNLGLLNITNEQQSTSDTRFKNSGEILPESKQRNCADNCSTVICIQNKDRLRLKGSPFYSKDLLLGSTAQAVEYWPCPRNLNQWNWEEFERYVSTSLNSFSRDTFKKAIKIYDVLSEKLSKPTNNAHNNTGPSPKEVYLTMVSDIRQICPINELADDMQDRNHKVQRYIVETSPSNQEVKDLSSSNLQISTKTSQKRRKIEKINTHDYDDQDPLITQHKPEFAHHTWDLFAFFGFEFDSDFVPQEKDLKFQSHIRQMVKRFVHRDGAPSDSYSDSVTSPNTSTNIYTLYAKNGTTLQVSKYKSEECRMWRKYIERSYAWVS